MNTNFLIRLTLTTARDDAMRSLHELTDILPADERNDPSIRFTIEMLQSVIFRLDRRIKAHENAVEASDAHS